MKIELGKNKELDLDLTKITSVMLGRNLWYR